MFAETVVPLSLLLLVPVAYALAGLVLFVVRAPVDLFSGAARQRAREARFLRSVRASLGGGG